ncbi:MAG: hypothetical protein A3J93_03725 [Candidatus Magasanikbacteria bacterium RIFOXYC2_FULL_42_28]|uniref:Uncharacterized protein n=1 Tax=Candidatus Magasanikbacteria bacterium RIFOXYC2_FULL_42_28 TaxID=1798704 RepID=A0A1F6NUK9_9BACT|nr:MAG: hypothetical protein A3J93_03725 [Candidatus Magasanikbacteria bacterium RIFOXYC2_FULL_42_28]
MLPLRTRIFIIISLVVLVVLGISVLVSVLSNREPSAPTTETPDSVVDLPAGTVLYNGAPVVVSPIENGLTPPPALTTLEAEQNSVRQLARIFTIRYNSYSTDANYQNIREVQSLVTDNLWAQISKPLAGNSVSANFLGVTTNVIGTELLSWGSDVAVVAVKTTSVQDKNGVESNLARSGTVNLVKTDGQWLVDKFAWEK